MSGVTKVGPMPVPTVEDVEYTLEIWRLAADDRQLTDTYHNSERCPKVGQKVTAELKWEDHTWWWRL
jgi:hypothetical protein